MKIDLTQFKTFQEYVDFMPEGIQVWLSRKTGLPTQTINRIYKKQVTGQMATLAKLQEVTGLPVEAFGRTPEGKIIKS